MRKLLLLGLALLVLAGCKKGTKAAKATSAQPAGASGGPSVHAPTGVVLNPAAGGGSGGAVQAVRMAATRTVNLIQLDQLRLFIETASGASGRMPTAQEITAAVQKEAPQIAKLVRDKAIILTGTRSRENIWAYTADPQDAAGQHLVVTSSSIERMPAADLRQRLQQQQGM
jgi:hypothetical protein